MGKKARFSLDKKLILLVLAVSLIATAATTALSLNLIDGILKEKIKAELLEESTLRGNAVRILLEDRIEKMLALSSSPLIKDTVRELSAESGHGTPGDSILENEVPVLVEIRNFQLSEGHQMELVDVIVFGEGLDEHVVLGDGVGFPPAGRIRQLAGDQLTEFVQGPEGQVRLAAAVPVRDGLDGDTAGVVAAIMDTERLDRILDSREGLQETGEVYMVNQDRVMISKSIFVDNAEFNQRVDTAPVSACFDGNREIHGEVYQDYRGAKIFGISHCQSDRGYVVLTEMDEDEVLIPLFELQRDIIAVSVGIMAVISGTAYCLSRRLSRPIRRLTEAAREISEGNFDVKTGIRTSDEIGELSRSFDAMARRLLESEITLSKQKEIIEQQEGILLRFSDRTENACVCFIDINESTKICAGLSDAETTSLYSEFINSMAALIRKYGGTVVKNIGDALLFYFRIGGDAQQKEFRNVLECCMALIDYHDGLCARLEGGGLPRIDYRVSVTFGPVSMASVSTSEVDDVFGSTVNLCAKINSYAEPNGLVVGERMYGKAGGLEGFEFVNIRDFRMSENRDLKIFAVRRA